MDIYLVVLLALGVLACPSAVSAQNFELNGGGIVTSAGRDAWASAGLLPKTGGGLGGFDFTRVCWNGQSEGQPGCIGELAPNLTDEPVSGSTNDWACTRDNVTGLVWSLSLKHAQGVIPWMDLQNGRVSTDIGHDINNRCGLSGWYAPNYEEYLSIVNFSNRYSTEASLQTDYFPWVNGNSVSDLLPWFDDYAHVYWSGFTSTSDAPGAGLENSSGMVEGLFQIIPLTGKFLSLGVTQPIQLGSTVSIAYRPVSRQNLNRPAQPLQMHGAALAWLSRVGVNGVDVDTSVLANSLNAGGFTDWRPAQLKEILHFGIPSSTGSTRASDTGSILKYGLIEGSLVNQMIYRPNEHYFLPVRGGSQYSDYVEPRPSQVTLTTIDPVGGRTVCSPSGTMPYGTRVECQPVPNEGFQIDSSYPYSGDYFTTCEPLTSMLRAVASTYPSFTADRKRLQLLRGHRIDSVEPLDQNWNITIPALIGSCAIKYPDFVQAASLVSTVVTPSEAGSLSCTGTGPNGWVALGEAGSCRLTVNSGFRLKSVSGCGGAAGAEGVFSTRIVSTSCVVTAHLEKVETIALQQPDVPAYAPGGAFSLFATATNDFPVSFAAEPPSVCFVTGNLVTMVGTGICTITAYQTTREPVGVADPVQVQLVFSEAGHPVEGVHSVPILGQWGVVLLGLLVSAFGVKACSKSSRGRTAEASKARKCGHVLPLFQESQS